MTITVHSLSEADEAAWDRFVDHCADASFYHYAGWRHAIEKTFGHRCPYLFAREDGEIKAILPLTHISSLLFGRALISNGFCVYGGLASDSQEASQALLEAAEALARELKVDFLELRHRRRHFPDWPASDLYVTFAKAISADEEENRRAMPRRRFKMIKKGIAFGLASVIDQDTERFFPLFAESVRNLGTPVFPRRWFAALKAVFGDRCQVLVVDKDGKPVAAVMSFIFRDQILPYYGGGGMLARDLAANDFMYWEVMRRAAESGLRHFDWGRSKVGTGAYAFKKNWGFEPLPLFYETRLFRADSLPEINPNNPKYRLMIDMWRRLPLAVANRLGPLIARNLG